MERVAHWQRRNDASRYPTRVLCMDSEARIEHTDKEDRHTFRLAVARYMRLSRTVEPLIDDDCIETFDPTELWRFVSDYTRRRERTVLFAHNLAYDLRLTEAFRILPQQGWHIAAVAIDAKRCWARFVREEASLCLLDTATYFPRSLQQIGSLINVPKLPLPKEDAPDEEWLKRCIRDVEITSAAVLWLFRWLKQIDAGSFRLTGPAQGFAFFRHKFLDQHALLIHDNTEALAIERKAAWAGRCEVWKHGKTSGYLYEWDYSLAYAHIARDYEVPSKYVGEVTDTSLDDLLNLSDQYAILAEMEVTTDVPVVPCEHDSFIVWPVGRFRTTLWDAELQLLLANGGTARLERAFVYRRAPLLSSWGVWITEALGNDSFADSPLAKIVLKGWARSTIGRFAMRYPKWVEDGQANGFDLLLDTFVDYDTNNRGAYLQLGRDFMLQEGEEEPPSSCPQITSYITALARVRLWEAMEFAGLEHVTYIDTDSLIVDTVGHKRLKEFSLLPGHKNLKLKARHHGASLLAPRHVELNGQRRISGLSVTAEKIADNTYSATTWQGIGQSLREGNGTSVLVRRSVHYCPPIDRRRFHLDDGRTAPIHLQPEGSPECLVTKNA